MFGNIRWLWVRLDANYWFYPALFVVGALLLAGTMVWLDNAGFGRVVEAYGPPLSATPGSAHAMLQIIAAGMFGAAATIFSITIAAVAYASGTYGPRLLANYLEDKGNQLSLAMLIGTFVYALVVMASIREDTASFPAGAPAPHLSLLCAYLLTAISVAAIVYMLNHIPSSIRINYVLEGIGQRLLRDIRKRFPEEAEGIRVHVPAGGHKIAAIQTGYVQLIDFDRLAELAKRDDCHFALEVRTGDFIHRGKPLLRVISGVPQSDITEGLHEYITVGSDRTAEQDLEFLIDELVEIALRALSPGINDPFTAITAIHWLGAATAEIGRRNLALDTADLAARNRVMPLPDDFEHYVGRGFGAARSAVAASPIAARVTLEALSGAGCVIDDPERRAMLLQEANLLVEQAKLTIAGPDLKMVEARHAEVLAELRR